MDTSEEDLEKIKELEKHNERLKESNKDIIESIKDNTTVKLQVDYFLSRPLCSCPFCGKQPERDLSKTGTSELEATLLRASEEYNEDAQYKRMIEELITNDPVKIVYRIMCRNANCLFPQTGFLESIEEVVGKWEHRA